MHKGCCGFSVIPAARKIRSPRLCCTCSNMPGPYKVKMDGSLMLLQPSNTTGERVDSLFVDMKQGTISHHTAQRLPEDCPVVLGVIGFVRLKQGAVVCLIAKAKRVTCAEDAVYHIKETRLIAHEGVKSDDADVRHAALLQEALDPREGAGRHMYFSYKSNITASAQQQHHQQQAASGPVKDSKSSKGRNGGSTKTAGSSFWNHWNKACVWNAALLQPLIDAGAHAFATPIMVGYAGQVHDVVLPCLNLADGKRVAKLSLTSRMDCRRSGTVAWRHGSDIQGTCAHLVETEVHLTLKHHQAAPQQAADGSTAQREPAEGTTPATDANTGEVGPDVKASPTTESSKDANVSTLKSKNERLKVSGVAGTTTTYSLVQMRGSLPGLWAATPDLSVCPKARVCNDSKQQAAAVAAHFKQLHQQHQRVVMAHIPGGCASEAEVLHRLQASLNSKETEAAPHHDVSTTTPATGNHNKKISGDGSSPVQQGELLVGIGDSQGHLSIMYSSSSSDNSSSSREGQHDQTAAVPAPGQQCAYNTSEQLLWQPAPRRRLVAELRDLTKEHGHFRQAHSPDGSLVQQQQSGLLWLSCGLTGTLDLTNLLQAELAMEWLEGVLQAEHILGEGHTLRSHQVALAEALDTMWANQGSVLADQMAAGGCASAAIIRSRGKTPTMLSRLSAQLMRAARFYAFNFNEAQRQDCCDILTGAYKIDPGVRPASHGLSTYSSLQLFMICSGWAVVQAVLTWLSATPVEALTVLYRVGTPAAAAVVLAVWLWFTRGTYCSRPLLAPQHVLTWDAGQRL